MGIIEPSNSEWSSPPVLVQNRSGSVRYCIDYRLLNDVTRKKCQFMRHELKFLGWIVGRNGISIPPENTIAVRGRRPPTCTQEVESFLGYINYHRSHIKNFAEIASPLYELTGQKARKIPFN